MTQLSLPWSLVVPCDKMLPHCMCELLWEPSLLLQLLTALPAHHKYHSWPALWDPCTAVLVHAAKGCCGYDHSCMAGSSAVEVRHVPSVVDLTLCFLYKQGPPAGSRGVLQSEHHPERILRTSAMVTTVFLHKTARFVRHPRLLQPSPAHSTCHFLITRLATAKECMCFWGTVPRFRLNAPWLVTHRTDPKRVSRSASVRERKA